MKNLGKRTKIIAIVLSATILTLIIFLLLLYLVIIPKAISNEFVLSHIKKSIKKSSGIELSVENPSLVTSLRPTIGFSADKISIDKDDANIFNIKKLCAIVSFANIFDKKITVKKLGADYIFADANKLMELSAPQGEVAKCDWRADFFESLLYVKKCLVLYQISPDTKIVLDASNLEITQSKNPKYVHFDVKLNISKKNDKLSLAIMDNDNVYIDKKKLYIKDCALNINKSKIFINALADQKNNFDLTLYSKGFDVKNITKLVERNLIIDNGQEILSYFKNISGDFDFKVSLSNDKTSGFIKFNKGYATIVPLNNLKVSLESGNITVDSDEIGLNDFRGFYNDKKTNPIKLSGSIKDYMKSFDTEIVIDAIATKEFSTKHLSRIIGYPLEIVGKAPTRIIYKSIYDKIDLIMMAKLSKGDDILVDGTSLSPTGYDRALKADLHFEKNILNINSINYYIAQTINKESKIKPILKIYGNVECAKGVMQNLGFEIPKPLPSEFLNVLIGQKIFKKGTIAGNLQVINTGKYPVLEGKLTAKKVRIPSQRLSIKDATLNTSSGLLNIAAEGKYKRSGYSAKAAILNEMKLPIIVKDVDLSVDNIDIDKILNSFNNQNTSTQPQEMLLDANADTAEDDMDAVTFNTGLLIVEKCTLGLKKGNYKEINFGNLKADLTLDEKGILNVKSNRFDIAEGISSCKVNCDLKNHLYSLVLGVKDINSDIMATNLLNLKKEISGKASGIISLNTDDSLRLSGSMKFVVKNGTIGKIGLIEYVLKFAALFRNPMAMISPSTFVDLVNVPEGNFDKITGDLTIKDNIMEKIIIKSSAPQLSSLIVGRFDLEARDATLRIYTKFSSKNKGFSGSLRNFSLNTLANRVPLSSRSDVNYYSSELEHLPAIEADERDCQIFLTKVDGDVERNNFISSLKKIK